MTAINYIYLLSKTRRNNAKTCFCHCKESFSKRFTIVAAFTLKKTRFKVIQLEKVRFIKVNELKLIQVELFPFFFTLCVQLIFAVLQAVLQLMHPNCFV